MIKVNNRNNLCTNKSVKLVDQSCEAVCKVLRKQCGISQKIIPTYLLQQHKDGMEFKASIKAFRKDGGGKDDYKWTILKYVL